MFPLINRKKELEIDNVFGLSNQNLKHKISRVNWHQSTSRSYKAVLVLKTPAARVRETLAIVAMSYADFCKEGFIMKYSKLSALYLNVVREESLFFYRKLVSWHFVN